MLLFDVMKCLCYFIGYIIINLCYECKEKGQVGSIDALVPNESMKSRGIICASQKWIYKKYTCLWGVEINKKANVSNVSRGVNIIVKKL